MKLGFRDIMILALIAGVVFLTLARPGCNGNRTAPTRVDVKLIYDSIKRVVLSEVPEADTIFIEGETITRWLPGAKVRDTITIEGAEVPIYMLAADIDTEGIISHYLTQAVTYIDTIRDNALQAIILDTIFRNRIEARHFEYKLLQPVKEVTNIYKPDRFQLIASFQAGAGMSYTNQPNAIFAGVDLGLKFKSGTYFSIGYMAGSGHFGTIRAGQVIRFKKPKLKISPL